MLPQLSEYINSFSNQARLSIHSVLTDVSNEKVEIGQLVNKLSSFSAAADYIPRAVRQLEPLQREVVVDLFRDVDLRIKTQFDVSNSLSLLSSSMNNIFGGEIEKIEKDIQYLNSYINNYSFISGEDDLYDSSFIENFDNELNSFMNESNNFVVPDRDGIPFSSSMISKVDNLTGRLKYSSDYELSLSDIPIDSIESIDFDYNFPKEYISSDTGADKLLSNSNSKSWSLTVKSPVLIKESIFDSEKYRDFRNRSFHCS